MITRSTRPSSQMERVLHCIKNTYDSPHNLRVTFDANLRSCAHQQHPRSFAPPHIYTPVVADLSARSNHALSSRTRLWHTQIGVCRTSLGSFKFNLSPAYLDDVVEIPRRDDEGETDGVDFAGVSGEQ